MESKISKVLRTLLIAIMMSVVACDASSGTFTSISDTTCEELKQDIIEFNAEVTAEDPSKSKILKIYDGVREIRRTSKRLECEGEVRVNTGGSTAIEYHLEEDSDGDFFYGYRLK